MSYRHYRIPTREGCDIIFCMAKNNQPLIIVAMIVGAALIITLALIFTRSSDDAATETTDENNTSENGANEGGENGNNGQQPTPTPTPTPIPTPTPTPTPTPIPTPQPGVLPANWNELTGQEKSDLNPFNCNVETQIIYATDGTCHDKEIEVDPIPASPSRITLPAEPTKADFVALLEPHLTEEGKLVLQTRTAELKDEREVASEGWCPPHRLFRDGSICGSYYGEFAYTFYDADNRDPHGDFRIFIHEFVHALDHYGHYTDTLDTAQHFVPSVNQAMLDVYNNPPADHNTGIRLAGTDRCLYTDYRYTLDLRGWELLYPLIPGKILPGQNRAQRFPAELYAVLAVEIRPLTPFLEEHYSQFFTDRQAVIDLMMATSNDQAWDGAGYGSHFNSNGCNDGPPPYSKYDPIPQL